MQFYKRVNVNPKHKETGDCVIRAIANAEGRDWYDVFDDLVKIAKKICSGTNYKDTYGKYLSKYPKVSAEWENTKGERFRLTPREFRDQGLGKGVYIVSFANHLTCVRNGIVEDTWDCSGLVVYEIWRIE